MRGIEGDHITIVADEHSPETTSMEQERFGDPSFFRISPSSCLMAGHKRRLTGALTSVPSPSCRPVFCDVTSVDRLSSMLSSEPGGGVSWCKVVELHGDPALQAPSWAKTLRDFRLLTLPRLPSGETVAMRLLF